jgi:anti-sigma factor RsiW
MTHPEELLAGYVDGSLTDKERAVVDAHLATCARCREEAELSSRAMVVLRSLPDEPVPFGVTNPVTAELGRRMRRPARLPWRARLQWGAGIAVAACLVLLAVLTLPKLGGGANDAAGGGGVAGAVRETGPKLEAAPTAAPSLERQDTDYRADTLRPLLQDIPASDRQSYSAQDATTVARGAAGVALRCVRQGADVRPTDVLVRLIDARFDGTPAYIAVFLEGPGAGQPATEAIVWVVRKDGCSLLSFASTRI